jgi:DNA primase
VASAIRQVKMDALKAELDQLFASGKSAAEIGDRFREISAMQDQLRKEAEGGLPGR